MREQTATDPRETGHRGLKQIMAEYERRLILEALETANGNQRQAARALGVLPTTLSEKMKRLGIRTRRTEGPPEPDTVSRSGGWGVDPGR